MKYYDIYPLANRNRLQGYIYSEGNFKHLPVGIYAPFSSEMDFSVRNLYPRESL